MGHQVVTVTEFKAKCLALLEGIGRHGGTITVTKRGRPLATVGPAELPAWKSPEGALSGKGTIPDNLESLDMSDLWNVVRDPDGQL